MNQKPESKVQRYPVAEAGGTRWIVLGVFAILAATFISYVPALRAGYIWDDDAYVLENESLRTVSGLVKIWSDPRATRQYYPLTRTSFWIEYRLWELNPAGYHAVNVLLHALSACLLWLVLRRLRVPGAFFAAAVFALHPVHVESVAWITERKNTLSAFFYLLSLLNGIAFYKLASSPSRMRPRLLYALSLFFFIAALLSKTVTVSLPAVVLLLLWWKRGRLEWRDVAPLIPFFAAGIVMAGVTVYCELEHVGARGAAWNLSLVDRILIAGRALWFYVGKLLWPRNLTFIYPRWEINATAAWQYLFPIGAAGMVFLLWRVREKLGRGPLVAVLVFSGTLVPALGFFNTYPMQYSFVADHFQYLASTALIALLVATVSYGLKAAGTGKRTVVVLAGALLPVLAALTWRQSRMYHDEEALWRQTLERNPAAWMGHVNLGKVLSARGDSGEAISHYREALRLRPDDAGAHNNLGLELMNEGDIDGAVHHFRQAATLWSNYPDAFYHLGLALQRRGELDEAMGAFRAAVYSRPAYPQAHNAMGIALAQQARFDDAAVSFGKALEYAPDYLDAHINLCRVLRLERNLEEAEMHGVRAVTIDPASVDAHYQLAMLRLDQNRLSDARTHFENAVRLDSSFALAHYQLALIFYRTGDGAAAVRALRVAHDLEPENPDMPNALAWMLATNPDESLRSPSEAVELALKACRLTGFKHPVHLDTLAAAYARSGDYDHAIETAHKALDAAKVLGWTSQEDEIRKHITFYETGQPYTDRRGGVDVD